MTALALIPIAVTCFVFGVGVGAPLAHRAGRRSAARDQEEIGRMLGGVAAPVPGDALPVQPGRQELTRHAAPESDIDWHRGEHRIYSLGWAVEVAARLLNFGYKPVLPVVEEHKAPRHAAWNVSTQEIATVLAEESRRRDDEFEALLYSLVAKGKVLR